MGGFEVNGENPSTDYRSGNAFHLDLSATKFLTKDFSVGAIASHYQQVTGDSGEGATLGPFKGRVTAVGGTVGYNFHVGQLPVSTRVKVLREVDVENRLQGTSDSCKSRFHYGSHRMLRRRRNNRSGPGIRTDGVRVRSRCVLIEPVKTQDRDQIQEIEHAFRHHALA